MSDTTENIPSATETPKKIDPNEYLPGEAIVECFDRSFDQDFCKVWSDEPFLGSICMYLTRIADRTKPTAYVCVKNGELVLGYNPEWLYQYKDQNLRIGVIKHEIYHVLFEHIFSRLPTDPQLFPMWNIATDLAINSLIGKDNLPDIVLLPGELPKGVKDPDLANLIKKFPKDESADYYFKRLQKFAEENGGSGDEGSYTFEIGNSGDGTTLDSHDGWSNLPDEVKEILSEKLRGMMEEGQRRAMEKGSWGSVSGSMQEWIKKMLSHEVDWRSIVRNFHGRCRSTKRDSTLKKINKKAPYQFPGCRRPLVSKFLYALDQSGSMSDEEIQKGFAEVFALSNEAEVDTVNFDTEVDEKSFQTWKKGNKPFAWKRTKCGGTDFDCVARYCNAKNRRGKYSGIILFSDGYAPTMGQIIGAKVLWIITENGTTECVRNGDLVVKMTGLNSKKEK